MRPSFHYTSAMSTNSSHYAVNERWGYYSFILYLTKGAWLEEVDPYYT